MPDETPQREDLGEVTQVDIQRFALACEDRNPLYFDPDYAAGSAYGGIIAPPTLLTSIVQFGAGRPLGDLRHDGLPRGHTPGAPGKYPRRMAGGQELEFHRPVRPGDHVYRERRVTSADERQGARGPLMFVVTEERYYNQADELLVVCRNTAIYR